MHGAHSTGTVPPGVPKRPEKTGSVSVVAGEFYLYRSAMCPRRPAETGGVWGGCVAASSVGWPLLARTEPLFLHSC